MIVPLLLGAAIVGLVYSTRRPATAGAAVRVGDEALVSLSALPPNSVPLQQGIVVMRVTALGPNDTLQGSVTGGVVQSLPNLQVLQLPAPVPIAAAIPRSSVVGVYRNGSKVA